MTGEEHELGMGMAEQEVSLAEQQAALLTEVISRVLDALDLTQEQRLKVPEVVPRELRAMAAEQAEAAAQGGPHG